MRYGAVEKMLARSTDHRLSPSGRSRSGRRRLGCEWPLRATLGIAILAAATPALAQPVTRPSVIVDWSALGPAQPRGLAPVHLKPPSEREAATVQAPPHALAAAKPAAAPKLAYANPPPALPPAPTTKAAAPTDVFRGQSATIRFTSGRADIPPEGQKLLQAIANRLDADHMLRLMLVAHAGTSGDDAIEARRVSLARALQMRSYLIEKGVAGVRMDVRALGNRDSGGGPPDRVDIEILNR